MVSNTQLESLVSCLTSTSFDQEHESPVAFPSLTHIHFDMYFTTYHYSEYFFCCWFKAATKLHSLHIPLQDNYSLAQLRRCLSSLDTTSSENLWETLQTLSLDVRLVYCEDLSSYIDFLMSLSNKHIQKLILKLELQLEPLQDDCDVVRYTAQLQFLKEVREIILVRLTVIVACTCMCVYAVLSIGFIHL